MLWWDQVSVLPDVPHKAEQKRESNTKRKIPPSPVMERKLFCNCYQGNSPGSDLRTPPSSTTTNNPSNLRNLEQCTVNSWHLWDFLPPTPPFKHVDTHTGGSSTPYPFLMRVSQAATSLEWGTSIMNTIPIPAERMRVSMGGGVSESVCLLVCVFMCVIVCVWVRQRNSFSQLND